MRCQEGSRREIGPNEMIVGNSIYLYTSVVGKAITFSRSVILISGGWYTFAVSELLLITRNEGSP